VIAPTPPTLWDAAATAHQQELRRQADQARLAHLARSRSRGGRVQRGRVAAVAFGHAVASLAARFLQPPPAVAASAAPTSGSQPPSLPSSAASRHRGNHPPPK
jgi:hypothetical protein